MDAMKSKNQLEWCIKIGSRNTELIHPCLPSRDKRLQTNFLSWPSVRPSSSLPLILAGAQFENSNDIGVFSKLTNAYCLVAIGGSENFYSYVSNIYGTKRLI